MIRPIRVKAIEVVLVRGIEFDRIELSHTPTPESFMALPEDARKGPVIGPASNDVPAQVRTAIAGVLGVIDTRVLLVAEHPVAREAAKEILRLHCTVLAVHSPEDRGYRVVKTTNPGEWPMDRIITADEVSILP